MRPQIITTGLLGTFLLLLSGCALNPDDPEGTLMGTRPATVVFEDFLNTLDDTVTTSGITFPNWDRNDTTGYVPESCGIQSREDGDLYQRQIEGGPSSNPAASADAMRQDFEAKGYTIGPTRTYPGDTQGIGVNAETPDGLFIQFTTSTVKSFINVISDCTADPAAKETTT